MGVAERVVLKLDWAFLKLAIPNPISALAIAFVFAQLEIPLLDVEMYLGR